MRSIYTVEAEEKLVYKLETTRYPICTSSSCIRQIVMTLNGTYQIINLGYGCPDKNCKGNDVVYSSEEAFHQSLWYIRYGIDAFAFIGEQHFCNHKTKMEIAGELKQYHVQITDREIGKYVRNTSIFLKQIVQKDKTRLIRLAKQGMVVSYCRQMVYNQRRGTNHYIF